MHLSWNRWAGRSKPARLLPVVLQATAEQALEVVLFDNLFAHALV